MSSNLASSCSRRFSTKAVSSCGLEMSEDVTLVGFVEAVETVEAAVEPLGDEGAGDGRDGVAAGVTFKGSAAEDGGGMANYAKCTSRLQKVGTWPRT